MPCKIFLFGEAEKGEFCTPFLCRTLPELAETFGNPPDESLGLTYAVQALLFKRDLIYFRVQEEGFSLSDYKKGLQLIEQENYFESLTAICMPGVGDASLINATGQICSIRRTLLITSEKDLYDYLTSARH